MPELHSHHSGYNDAPEHSCVDHRDGNVTDEVVHENGDGDEDRGACDTGCISDSSEQEDDDSQQDIRN